MLQMTSSIRKVVIPIAGRGIRFLPATKVSPKEMMPIIDKPLIQYAVEEASNAGIKELIFITNKHKRSIEDHFDRNVELEEKLLKEGKDELLDLVTNIIPKDISCMYIRQMKPLGLGHAVLCAKDAVGHEPFAVILPDDLIDGGANGCIKMMAQEFEKVKASIVAIQKINLQESEKYGVVGFVENNKNTVALQEINQIIEKPKPIDAPSSFGVVGRYILTPDIFSILEKTQPGYNDEIQLTDAISQLLKNESVYGYQFKGQRFDCGSKLGYLEAIVTYGLKHSEVGSQFKQYLDTLNK